MYTILMLCLTFTLTLSAPFSSFDLKRPTDPTTDDKTNPETITKLLSIVKKNLKPNKDQTTLLVTEELVFSSTGYPTFDAFDQNSNGFIEFEEFTATDGKDHKNNFQRADLNGDQKLSPEEFSGLPLVVYEPEQFSDSDEEPPVVFLTPPESITRGMYEKETYVKPDPDSGFDDYKEIPVFVSTVKEEPKDDKPIEDRDNNNKEETKPENEGNVEITEEKTDKNVEKLEKTETKAMDKKEEKEKEEKEGSHFTADDMPVKIDDEDDEEMVEVKDEDIPMEVIDDLNDDNHYDLDDVREPEEDDRRMNDQLNSIEK